jgi:hypothetical protein
MKRFIMVFGLIVAIVLGASGVQAGDAPRNPGAPQSSFHSFQSLNYPDRYMAHQEFLGVLIEVHSDQDKKDSTFKLIEGLADRRAVTFESVNFPGFYLRHRSFRIHLEHSDGTDTFKEDATFWLEAGNANPLEPGAASFRSFNYPGRFIRHTNFQLWLQEGDDRQFKEDSTFKIVPPNWPAVAAPSADGVQSPSSQSQTFQVGNIVIQYGTYAKTASGGYSVQFRRAYARPPVVLVTPFWQGQNEQVENIESVVTITESGFTGTSLGYGPNYFVEWMAIGTPEGQ